MNVYFMTFKWSGEIYVDNITIEMFPADNGDSFLISCKGKYKTNILIDMGYEETYKEFIKPRLIELKERGERLDLVILTHIDADHIEGAQFFFEENGYSSNPKVIEVKEVWHNSYRHLAIKKEEQPLSERIVKRLSRKIKSLPTKKTKNEETKVNAEQGTRIASLLYHYQYRWNTSFDGTAVMASGSSIELNEEVKLALLTPTLPQLERLKSHWLEGLQKLFPGLSLTDDQILDDAIEFVSYLYPDLGVANLTEKTAKYNELDSLAEIPYREDRSIVNGSSITFCLEFEDKRMLFMGDISSTGIKKEIEKMFPDETSPIHFDVIKVAHHGSKANTSRELLKIIDSDNYLISTNGSKHRHPHIETLARIVTRTSISNRKLHFNYETNASSKMSQVEWEKKYNYSIVKPVSGKSSIIVI
ncbi:MBL fold metallo-hydrolase [Bacillus toyonensis]|nr:MBL fold metallo-hydrolase [Bacillus toyonensis]PGB31882.1 MBL fold metallo-hydrolase [Bacillus toyonensis]PHG54321.1 MBL fold metallo-hydrolase [Bacillus toyonensis]